jgi:hypothetical protein
VPGHLADHRTGRTRLPSVFCGGVRLLIVPYNSDTMQQASLVFPFFIALTASATTAGHEQSRPATPAVRAEDGARVATQSLPDEEARAIAVRFAPRFRFHPDEAYLPVHPLFVLGAADREWPEGAAAVQALGSTGDRIRRYLELTQAEKVARATVFYHVYRDERLGPRRIVAEYWLYFVESRYRTQGGFFPFSLDLSHPNDFERVFLILAPGARSPSDARAHATDLVIERIVANVHDGRVPNHVKSFGAGEEITDRPLLLVERGSHALAPDVDGDGHVLATQDVEPRRITWGLRDTGRIWAWQSPGDAERREPGVSMTLIPRGVAGPEGDPSYELQPIARVDRDFHRLALVPADAEEKAFRGHVNPFARFFGKNDGGAPSMRRPSTSPEFGNANRMENDSLERQRGLSVGFTNTVDSYTVILGGRWPLATPGRPWPALTADVGVVFPSAGPVVDAELLASYEIDTQVDLFAGAAWLVNSSGQRQADWLAGLQLQLGRIRFRGAYRRGGDVNDDQADFRIQFDLWK